MENGKPKKITLVDDVQQRTDALFAPYGGDAPLSQVPSDVTEQAQEEVAVADCGTEASPVVTAEVTEVVETAEDFPEQSESQQEWIEEQPTEPAVEASVSVEEELPVEQFGGQPLQEEAPEEAVPAETQEEASDASPAAELSEPELTPQPETPAVAPETETPKSKKRTKGHKQGFEKLADRRVIELSGVAVYHSRGFGSGRPKKRRDDELVLSDVNLTVRPGEMVYLIGRVGSGKSTLLKTLYAEVPLLEGRGEIVGFDLRKLRRRDVPYLRRKIGVVFQDYQLLTDRNVFANLHYVMSATGWRNERDMRRRIEEVLGLVGLHNKEYKMPFELSGGEQQRLAIARAMINRPEVILADEPTGNLDPAAAEEIMRLFRDIVRTGCSIVMSTHNIGNIQLFPGRAVRFAAGRVEEINIGSILGI